MTFNLERTLELSRRVIKILISGSHSRNTGFIGIGCGLGSALKLDFTIIPSAELFKDTAASIPSR